MYQFVKIYFQAGLYCYFQKISVVGKENIPRKGAVMFISNHPNALLDPLLIGITNNRKSNFLTRAGVFKNKSIIRFFTMMKMIPIYRIRDGWSNLSKNEAIFETCYDLLNTQEALVIFAEGSHNIKKRIRPLSKGFTRILFGTVDKYPELPISIIPVGINYSNSVNFPCQVSIHYGTPIDVTKHYSKDTLKNSIDSLKEVVSNSLKELTVHIEDQQNYQLIKNNLDALEVDYLNPKKSNKILKRLLRKTLHKKKITTPINWWSPLYLILLLNSLIPWLLWKKASKNIQEIEFLSTFRFAFFITLFPLFYLFQSLAILFIFGGPWHWYYLLFCFLAGFLYVKLAPLRC
ncbi:MAG: 1-acyl-sn-glycerol-3-phosphate acyltransferase [Flavobacteriaceae bacterium]|nr:1-acyl-sn-glycerol-3-phosphate acyltransferase [Flavobacteriaceae bacterium]